MKFCYHHFDVSGFIPTSWVLLSEFRFTGGIADVKINMTGNLMLYNVTKGVYVARICAKRECGLCAANYNTVHFRIQV